MPAQAQGKGPYGLRFWPKGSGFRFCARADAQRAHTGAGARSVHLGTAFILVEPGLSHVGLGFSVRATDPNHSHVDAEDMMQETYAGSTRMQHAHGCNTHAWIPLRLNAHKCTYVHL